MNHLDSMWRSALILVLIFLAPRIRANTEERTIYRDIEYGQAAGLSLKLDVSMPNAPGNYPVAVLVHGGGWSSGSKAGSDKPGNGADITPWFAAFSACNVVWFSVDYRLAPQHPWPEGFEDIQTAIRWVKAHAASYHGDPTRIVLVGHSSGGLFACLAGTLTDSGTRVQAVVGFAPVTDLEQDSINRGGLSTSLQALFGLAKELTPQARLILREHSPLQLVSAGLPPVLILHGNGDRTVPIAMSRAFQERMHAAGNTCDLIELPGAPHGLLTWDKFQPDYVKLLDDWLKQHLAVQR